MRTILHCRGDKGEADLITLFDSGSIQSFCSRRVAESLATVVPLPYKLSFRVGNGNIMDVGDGCILAFQIEDKMIVDFFVIREAGAHDLIIGSRALHRLNMQLDFGDCRAYRRPRRPKSTRKRADHN